MGETMTAPPLTDEQFERSVLSIEQDFPTILLNFAADARLHRAELAEARAENERLREASEEAEAILTALTVWFDTGLGDVTMPRTGGKIKEDVEKVLVVVRAALAPEGKEKPWPPSR